MWSVFVLALVLRAAEPSPAAASPLAELQRGREALAAGDLEGARGIFQGLAAQFPGWGLAQVELGEVLLKDGSDPDSIGRALAACQDLEPQNPRVWQLVGLYHQGKGDEASAAVAFKRAIVLKPSLIDARFRLASILAHAGQGEEAKREYAALLELDPANAAARLGLAELLEKNGDLPGAERELKALVSVQPSNPAPHRRLADFYQRQGKARLAAAEERKAEPPRPARKLRQLPPSRQ